jgi:hypothetical protein
VVIVTRLTESLRELDAQYAAWNARYASPAQDIIDLRNDLRDGVVDFGAFEMSDR